MPFTPYRGSLGPGELDILQAAFDAAVKEASALPDLRLSQQEVRDLLARRIVDAAMAGVRDPDQLRRLGLAELARQDRAS